MHLRTILRVAGVIVAALSAVMLAWASAGLEPIAPALLLAAEAALSAALAPVETFVLRPILDALEPWTGARDLLPHWKHVFILTWFVIATFVLATERWMAASPFGIVWGGVCALIAGSAAGTMALSDPYVTLAVGACFALFGIVAAVWEFATDLERREQWNTVWLLAILPVFYGLFFLLVPEAASMPMFGPNDTKPFSFPNAAGFWLYWTALYLGFGFYDQGSEGDTLMSRWLTSPFTRAGLSTLAVAALTALALSPALVARGGG
jgi:hypothetical protein